MASTASSSLNKSISYDDHDYEEESSMKKYAIVDLSQNSDLDHPEVLCCGDAKLPKIFLLIFGLGAFVGFIDYFLVKDDLSRKYKSASYRRPEHLGVSLGSSFDDFLAHYGKSYETVADYDARKQLFEASKQEILRIQTADGPKATYTMELNEFADMSEKEFKTFWTGGRPLDERMDTHSVFYDFEEEKEIDNLYVQKYLDEIDTGELHFDGEDGTLHDKISDIVPNNHYGPIGDEVLDNPFDKIGELSYDEASQNFKDMDFEKSIGKDDKYDEIEGYVQMDQDDSEKINLIRRLQPKVQIWPFEAIKPLELDWREQGAVSRVKRQGRCGACWAITATGALEGANAIQKGKLVEMSEQQILDCASMEPFRSVKCDGGYISEALRYSKTTLIATRDNYPYLGFNNTCRKIGEKDLISFKDVPKIQNAAQFQSLVEFWSLYYQNKFINEFPDVVIQQIAPENKVKASEQQFELYYRNLNLVHLEMDEYQIPISSQDVNLDVNHQWKLYNSMSDILVSLFSSDEIAYVDPVTDSIYTVEQPAENLTAVKSKNFYRLWQSSPRKLKKALIKGPVTVMVNSKAPFKFYKDGVIDTKECESDVDHAVLAVGYGTYTNEEGKVDGYFIVKNSWGRYWGEQGYARITANRKKFGKGVCGIYVESYIPFVETDKFEIDKFKSELK